MPLDSSPVTTATRALAAKRQAASGKLSTDLGFYGGLIPGNEPQIAGLLDAGVLGIKAFLCPSGIDEFPAATERELRAAMPDSGRAGPAIAAHARAGEADASDARSAFLYGLRPIAPAQL